MFLTPQPLNVVAFGVPGAGKSTVSNFLIGDLREGSRASFKAQRSTKGVTRHINVVENRPLLGKHADCPITMVDIPGIGDPTLSSDLLILEECERKLGSRRIDSIRYRPARLEGNR